MVRPNYRDFRGSQLVAVHSAEGSSWKKHQYIKRKDGVYYYPDSYEGGRHLPDGEKADESESDKQASDFIQYCKDLAAKGEAYFDDSKFSSLEDFIDFYNDMKGGDIQKEMSAEAIKNLFNSFNSKMGGKEEKSGSKESTSDDKEVEYEDYSSIENKIFKAMKKLSKDEAGLKVQSDFGTVLFEKFGINYQKLSDEERKELDQVQKNLAEKISKRKDIRTETTKEKKESKKKSSSSESKKGSSGSKKKSSKDKAGEKKVSSATKENLNSVEEWAKKAVSLTDAHRRSRK